MSASNVGARLEGMAVATMQRQEVGGPILAVDWAPAPQLGWVRWCRSAARDPGAIAWPSGGTKCVAAVVRLDKTREAADFAVVAARSVMSRPGPMVLFGGNDEGIRSVRSLGGVEFQSVEAGGHGRVLLGHAVPAAERGLSDFRKVGQIALPGHRLLAWVSYPGCFARGGLDRGTELLLETLGDVGLAPGRVLDFATGTGVIAAAVRLRWPAARVTGCDADTLALCAARENVPDARFVAGDGLAAVATETFDLILSNPPFHEGKARADRVWREFLDGARERLAPGGELRIVVQREVRVESVLAGAYDAVRQVEVAGGFVVWSARRRGAKP